MNSESESFNSNNGLISNSHKRKKTKVPNYNSTTSETSNQQCNMNYIKPPYIGTSESLRDFQYDYLWKFTCVGDCSVGKSSVLNLYKNVYYNPEDSKPTPGLGLVETRVNFHRYRIHLQVWDTSGDPRFSCLTASLYRDSMAFLLMYDVTKPETFNSVKIWADHIRTHAAKHDPIIYLVANKTDVASQRVISEEQGRQLKEELELEKYLECCVFDTSGSPDRSRVVQLFADILNEMIQSVDEEIDKQSKTLLNHKAFRSKLKMQDKFLYMGHTDTSSEEKSGLCSGCCSCLPILR